MQSDYCSRHGCKRSPYARGMCATHYELWRRKFPQKLGRQDSRKDVLRALPATSSEVCTKIELSKDRVVVIIRELRDAGKIYVDHYVPPIGRGGPWKPVYARGNKPDAVLDPLVVLERARSQRRLQHAERVKKMKMPPDCTADALLYADVFGLAKRKESRP